MNTSIFFENIYTLVKRLNRQQLLPPKLFESNAWNFNIMFCSILNSIVVANFAISFFNSAFFMNPELADASINPLLFILLSAIFLVSLL